MKQVELKSVITECQYDELTEHERGLIDMAIKATGSSYAPYSHFRVGAAVELANSQQFIGCNQENAAFPAGLCAERTAIFAAGAQYPDVPVAKLAIAARGTDGELTAHPISPCGTCRQVIIETESRFKQPVQIYLYGRERIYIIKGISQLMPLSFSKF